MERPELGGEPAHVPSAATSLHTDPPVPATQAVHIVNLWEERAATSQGEPGVPDDPTRQHGVETILAPLRLRAGAVLIDYVVVMLVLAFVPPPVPYVLAVALYVAYQGIFVWLTGQTAGKALRDRGPASREEAGAHLVTQSFELGVLRRQSARLGNPVGSA
jgi:hypothetical protein